MRIVFENELDEETNKLIEKRQREVYREFARLALYAAKSLQDSIRLASEGDFNNARQTWRETADKVGAFYTRAQYDDEGYYREGFNEVRALFEAVTETRDTIVSKF